MDARVFDHLTRQLGSQVPRRTLGGLLAVLLSLLGLPSAAEGKRRRSEKRRGGHQPGRHDRHKTRGQDQADRLHADGKKGKGKKGKKGKGKKKKVPPQSPPPPGTASPPPPQSPPPPPSGGNACPANTLSCDGACLTGNVCCETRFAECVGPVANDWNAAVDGCRDVCTDREDEACRSCLQDVAETFADPLTNCLRFNCQASAARNVERDAEHAAASPAAVARGCNRQLLIACRRDAVISNTVAGGSEAIVAFLELPIFALGPILLHSGLLWEDIKLCESQYGCPDGECNGVSNICCGDAQHCSWVENGVCQPCPDDFECYASSRICQPKCKQCHDYLVDGRQMPCGQITNNCNQVLTCNGCPQGKRCENRRCVECASRRSAKGRQALGDDECCLPQTCADFGGACGTFDDGCEGTVSCGCPDGEACNGQGACECERRTCAWYLDFLNQDCLEGTLSDGCSSTITCNVSCPSGQQCVGGRCCPQDRVCGDVIIGIGCCPQPGRCCIVHNPAAPSGLAAVCCPDGTFCQTFGGTLLPGFCQEDAE